MRIQFLGIEVQISHYTRVDITHGVSWVCGVYRCVEEGIGMCPYAARPGCGLCF
jgi:hypothetical protein